MARATLHRGLGPQEWVQGPRHLEESVTETLSVEQFFEEHPLLKIALLICGILILVHFFNAIQWTTAALCMVVIPLLFLGAVGLLTEETFRQVSQIKYFERRSDAS